jgi:geranylgeranyl pyrophosphate synthase
LYRYIIGSKLIFFISCISYQRDLLDALVDKQVSKGLYSLADNPLQFTRDLQEMAKYYFGQGGKLIRPTISLLMSAACNQHVKR